LFTEQLASFSGFAPLHTQSLVASVHTPTVYAVEHALRLTGFGLPGHGDFQVKGFASLENSAGRITVEQFQQALRSGAFVEELNRLRNQLREEFDLDRSASITVAGLSLGVSVVYVLWLVRGGVLLGSYLSALPAWRLLDPLPVLARAGDDGEDEEDEAFEPEGPDAPDPLRGFA
ncbi:MAG TPA: hypothetical protein VGD76_21810, partial [Ramlibacter sp.]